LKALNKAHSNLLCSKLKELQSRKSKVFQQIPDKQGRLLITNEKKLDRVGTVCGGAVRRQRERAKITCESVDADYTVSEGERIVMQNLPKGNDCGDDLPAELLQFIGKMELKL